MSSEHCSELLWLWLLQMQFGKPAEYFLAAAVLPIRPLQKQFAMIFDKLNWAYLFWRYQQIKLKFTESEMNIIKCACVHNNNDPPIGDKTQNNQ